MLDKLNNLIFANSDVVLNLKSPLNGEKMFIDMEDYYDFLQGFVDIQKKYFNSVVDHVIGSRLAYVRHENEPEKISYEIQKLDSARRSVHNSLIAQCSAINRICEALNVEKVCDVDIDDRNAVNAFCFKFCTEVFRLGSEHLKDFDEYLAINTSSIGYMRDEEKYLENFQNGQKIVSNFEINDERWFY